jgi:hypothetical protein
MTTAVEVTVRVAGLRDFHWFVVAAGEVVRAYEAVCGGCASTALGAAIDDLRSAMRNLADDV